MARNRYEQLIERIFLAHYKRGNTEVTFEREEIAAMAKRIGIEIPKNLGDLIYSFRYRVALPSSITDKAPKGKEWIIRPVGRSKYQFVLVTKWAITPNPSLSRIKVPDATPGMITKYALSDEQALLAKLRYNRLIDILLCRERIAQDDVSIGIARLQPDRFLAVRDCIVGFSLLQ